MDPSNPLILRLHRSVLSRINQVDVRSTRLSLDTLPNREKLQQWTLIIWTFLKRKPPLVFAMAVLGLGLTGVTGVLVKGLRNVTDTITVTGASTEQIRSDYIPWSVEVSHA